MCVNSEESGETGRLCVPKSHELAHLAFIALWTKFISSTTDYFVFMHLYFTVL